MLEVHPFGNFVPKMTKYLLLGSFTTKPFDGYDWFYSNKRNQFWDIMSEVYDRRLYTKHQKQRLFRDLHMALGDIIYSCERLNESHLDINLVNITYNLGPLKKIIHTTKPEKIFFTSKFVERKFKKLFANEIADYPRMKLVCLPSPSPRYAVLSKMEKTNIYKKLLPRLKTGE